MDLGFLFCFCLFFRGGGGVAHVHIENKGVTDTVGPSAR